MGLFDNETVVAGEVDSWDRAAARILREKYVTLLTTTTFGRIFLQCFVHELSWYESMFSTVFRIFLFYDKGSWHTTGRKETRRHGHPTSTFFPKI